MVDFAEPWDGPIGVAGLGSGTELVRLDQIIQYESNGNRQTGIKVGRKG